MSPCTERYLPAFGKPRPTANPSGALAPDGQFLRQTRPSACRAPYRKPVRRLAGGRPCFLKADALERTQRMREEAVPRPPHAPRLALSPRPRGALGLLP